MNSETLLGEYVKQLEAEPMNALEIMRTNLLSTRFYADLRQMCEEFRVTHLIEIGAHRGDFISTFMGAYGFRGQVLSFEPSPETFASLSQTSSFYREWTVRQQAVGIKSGKVRFYVDPTDSRRSRLASRGDPVDCVIDVEQLDIRQALELGFPQGATSVLRFATPGQAGEMLARIGPRDLSQVFVVMLCVAVDQNPDDHVKAVAELGKAGFVVADYYPRESWRSGIFREGEMIYMRRNLLPAFQ